MMEEELLRITMAALLHDIGKFWQRTGEGRPPGFEPFAAPDYGPHGAHAVWSAAFVERFLPPFWREVGAMVLYHHRPTDHRSRIVALADWLSAGERVEEEPGRPLSRLRSVFDRLRLPDLAGQPLPLPELSEGEGFYYPLAPFELRPKEEMGDVLRDLWFLNPVRGNGRATPEEYRRLWEGFAEEAGRLKGLSLSPSHYLETLYHLLRKYTWCVPSAYWGADPDVSLFDHSRTTAAIAVCLWLDRLAEQEVAGLLEALAQGRRAGAVERPRFLLVGGDLSGLQDFLYTITSRGAAKGLRGRSLYLDLLCEAVARFVLRELGLPLVNLLYLGGGNFWLLAPLGSRRRLEEEVRPRVSERLLRAHRGDLWLALEAVEVRPADLLLAWQQEQEASAWARTVQRLREALDRSKQRRFLELDPALLHRRVFDPQGPGGQPRFCQVCQQEEGEEDEEGVRKCPLCRSLEGLGGEAARAGWMLWVEREPEEPSGRCGPLGWPQVLRTFGWEVRLVGRLEEVDAPGGRGCAHRLRRTDFLAPFAVGWLASTGADLALGFDLRARAIPHGEEGQVLTFDQLAKRARGTERLGVLRMDVDGLGRLLAEGLGPRASASRLATLSSLLSAFFRGWLGVICDRFNQQQGAALYLTYSGGDDLFLVGPWDRMPQVARCIREHFHRFVCENPSVTISAGIAVVPGKYPLYRAAQLAGRALEEGAKEVRRLREVRRPHEVRPVGKDAVCFLGCALGWERFAEVEALRELLLGLLGQGLPRGLLARLGTICALYRRNERERAEQLGRARIDLTEFARRIRYDRWRWRLVYQLARLGEAYGGQEARQRLEELRGKLLEGDERRAMEALEVAVRWAALLTRQVRQQQGG